MKFSRPSRRGFTLIEIMIAVVIFTMVIAAMQRSTIRSRRTVGRRERFVR